MADGKLFVVGARGSGVVMVKTEPFRVTFIKDADIKAWGKKNEKDGYGMVAAAAAKMTSGGEGTLAKAKLDDLAALIGAGAVISTADFAFVSKVSNSAWDVSRLSVPPIQAAMEQLSPASAPAKAGALPAAAMKS
jgi:hypothetical protein